MDTHGIFEPTTLDDARTQYELVGPAAQIVVKEIAKAMEFTTDDYNNRITSSVIETARDALFANLLKITTGTRDEYESYCATTDYEPILLGSEHVDHVAWHTIPFANTIIAATYQNEQAAAIATLQRQAYGRIYRDHLTSRPTE